MKTRPNKKVCHKVEYATKEKAREAFKEYGKARGATRFYKCPYHNGREVWHLTSH